MTKNIEDNQAYCMNMVRHDDPERYLTVLFAPADKRRSLFALYAFNQEVAKTRENVSEAMIGEIRLQWWTEAIEQILSGHVREHPVVMELGEINNLKELAPLFFDIIAARKSDLYSDGVADIKALTDYAQNVGGKLCDIAVRICNDKVNVDNNIAVSCGTAWALMGLIRAIPFHDDSETSPLSFGIDRSAEEIGEQIKPLVIEVSNVISESLEEAASGYNKRQDNSPLLLTSILTGYMRALIKADYNPYEMHKFEAGKARKILSMLWQGISGRISLK